MARTGFLPLLLVGGALTAIAPDARADSPTVVEEVVVPSILLVVAGPAVVLDLPAGVGNLLQGARGYRTGAGLVVLGFVTSTLSSLAGHFFLTRPSARARVLGVCLEVGSLFTLATAIWASRQPFRPDDG